MKESRFDILMAKSLANELSSQESLELQVLLENANAKAQKQELEDIWLEAGELEEAVFAFDGKANWQDLTARLEKDPIGEGSKERVTSEKSSTRFIGWVWKAAAVVFLLAGLAWFVSNNSGSTQVASDDITNPNPKQSRSERVLSYRTEDSSQQYDLPDGSVVWLNRNSSFTYHEGADQRKLELTGEAYFDIAHKAKQQFVVKAGVAQVSVLGTAFNVRAYSTEPSIDVQLDRGKILFEAGEQEVEIVESGQASYSRENNNFRERTGIDGNFTSWLTEKLSFKNTPFDEVVMAFERHFDTKLEVGDSNLSACRFTGEFLSPNEEELMEALSFALGLDSYKKSNIWTISGDGCLEEWQNAN